VVRGAGAARAPGRDRPHRRPHRLPIAVGERLHSRAMFKPILDLGAADYLMPDITRCGGISEMRKIANLAEAYHVPIAPHNPNGPSPRSPAPT
jgi:galactonate dehydratase